MDFFFLICWAVCLVFFLFLFLFRIFLVSCSLFCQFLGLFTVLWKFYYHALGFCMNGESIMTPLTFTETQQSSFNSSKGQGGFCCLHCDSGVWEGHSLGDSPESQICSDKESETFKTAKSGTLQRYAGVRISSLIPLKAAWARRVLASVTGQILLWGRVEGTVAFNEHHLPSWLSVTEDWLRSSFSLCNQVVVLVF